MIRQITNDLEISSDDSTEEKWKDYKIRKERLRRLVQVKIILRRLEKNSFNKNVFLKGAIYI